MADKNAITEKVRRLIRAQRHLLYLMRNNMDVEIYHAIDESFYMQKVAELDFMLEQIAQIDERRRKFNAKLAEEYAIVFQRWRNDARRLNKKLAMEDS